MLDKILSNPTMEAMTRALDGSSLRQKAIANNLANDDTPGYKAIEVSFEENLRKALRKGPGTELRLNVAHPRHIQILGRTNAVSDVQAEISVLEDVSFRNDGNSVDVDREMARLAKNEIYYDTVTRSLNEEFKILRLAISEGRK